MSLSTLAKEKLAARPKDSFVISEYMESTGLSHKQARARIDALYRAGKIRPVSVPILTASQCVTTKPGYQIVDTTVDDKRRTRR